MTINSDNQAEPPDIGPIDDVEEPLEPNSDAGPVLAPYHKDAMPTDPDEGAQL